MGDLTNQPWRGDQLAQAMADRLAEHVAAQTAGNPLVPLLYGRYRPLVHDALGRLFGPVDVPKRGKKK